MDPFVEKEQPAVEIRDAAGMTKDALLELLKPCLSANAHAVRHNATATPWRLVNMASHEVVPADSCAGASVAILREPCERLASMYRHFEILWGLKLHSHWVRHAPDADAFAHAEPPSPATCIVVDEFHSAARSAVTRGRSRVLRSTMA